MMKTIYDRLIDREWQKPCRNASDAHWRADKITRLQKLKENSMKKLLYLTILILSLNAQAQNLNAGSNPTLTGVNNYQNVNGNGTITLLFGASLTTSNLNNQIIICKGNNTITVQNLNSTNLTLRGNTCIQTNNISGSVTISGKNNNINATGNINGLLMPNNAGQTVFYNGQPNNQPFANNEDFKFSKLNNYSCPSFVDCAVSTVYENGVWSNGFPDSFFFRANIKGDYTAPADLKACSIVVDKGDLVTQQGVNQGYSNVEAELIIPSGKNIEILQNITISNTEGCQAWIVLENNANLIQHSATATNLGRIWLKRNSTQLFRLDYSMWSSSVTGQSLAYFSPFTATNRFYEFIPELNQYNSITPQQNFQTGKGYLIRMPNAINGTTNNAYYQGTQSIIFEGVFKGTPNNGNINVAVSADYYNAIGNPYPSPVSINKFIDDNQNNFEGTLYFWRKTNNPDLSTYATVTKFGFVANQAYSGAAGGTDPQGILRQGQGFIVKAKAGANTVNFNNEQRIKNNTDHFLKTQTSSSKYWLSLDGEQILAGYSDSTSKAIEEGVDGQGMNSSFYMPLEGSKFVIQGRGSFSREDVLELGFNASTAGEHTIKIDSLDNFNYTIYLRDKMTGIEVDLSTPYTFFSAAGEFNERFEIAYENKTLSVQSNVKENFIIWSDRETSTINIQKDEIKSVSVYDLTGRILYSGTTGEKVIKLEVKNQAVIVVVDGITKKLML